MVQHENKLRVQIKEILRHHATGVDLRKTPLDDLKTLEPTGSAPDRPSGARQ